MTEQQQQTTVIHSAGYEIFKNLFKHWIGDRFPEPREVHWQANLQRLTFARDGAELTLVMNLAYLRDKTISTRVTRRDCVKQLDESFEADLLDADFLVQLEAFLEPFRPPKGVFIVTSDAESQ